jgi:predicted nucleotidyltransferase
MMEKNDASDAIVKTVLRFYPDVEAAYLFGSHGTEHQRPDSDADVALLFPPPLVKTITNPAMSECSRALTDVLKKSVDLINLRAENAVFQHEVIQEGKIIYRRSEYAVDEYEMLVMSLYQKLNEERADILQEIFQTGRIVGP